MDYSFTMYRAMYRRINQINATIIIIIKNKDKEDNHDDANKIITSCTYYTLEYTNMYKQNNNKQ